ncbi:MAG: DegV family protein [Acidimicrobiia bacterium]|nr:DegV family protein [Acidimicrobiia bacterium]
MIRIVTDSSADLPTEVVDRHRITVAPLTIRFGDEEYVDRRDLDPPTFWAKLGSAQSLPETAAPSAGTFLDAFRSVHADGASGVVAICLSSAISATYQSAVIAAEDAPLPVKVVDSRTVSMALGLQVLHAATAAESGADLDGVVAAALSAVEHTDILAALDTLEFLKRGGRIGGAQAFIGGLLDVKPLITFADGAVAPAGRVRTRSKALAALVARVSDRASQLEAVAVMHGGGAGVEALVDAIREAVPGIEPIVAELGPVVGTHSGPGVLAVAYRTG